MIKQAGGLHQFIQRRLPIITDSGGFQVFSLAYGSVADELKSRGLKKQGGSVIKITEEGQILGANHVAYKKNNKLSKVLIIHCLPLFNNINDEKTSLTI